LTLAKFTVYALTARQPIKEKLFANPLDCSRNFSDWSGVYKAEKIADNEIRRNSQ
jgi:hypothetical protein